MEENNNIETLPSQNPVESVPKTDNTQKIVGAILLAGLMVAGAILLKGNRAPSPIPEEGNGDSAGATQIRPVSKDDHIKGNLNAKIVIVEYSDLECPFCKAFHGTMQRVIENNKNVAWVYRHYPIPQLHSKAIREAEATECAWEQGGNDAFWKYTDRIFEITPSNDGLPESELPKIAGELRLDVAAFNVCLESGKFKAKIQADVEDGARAGVRGTPASFIVYKGKVVAEIPGAQPYETVIKQLSGIK